MSTLSRIPGGPISGLQDEMERAFRQIFGDTGAATAGAWSPLLDVEETDDAFTLHVEIPGVKPEDVEVSLEESVLTIEGERSFYDERASESFRRVERRFGRFHRAVRLPDRVDGDRVEARYADGLLTIVVPKADEAKPRRIAISAS